MARNDEIRAVQQAVLGERTSPALRALLERCPTRTWSPGEHLVDAGCPAPDVFFLHTGLVQLYLLDVDGRMFTKAFHREGRFSGAHAAATTGAPATFSIRALEEVRATRVSFAALDALAVREPELQLFLRRTAEALFWFKERRERSLLSLSATERYQELLEEAPWLVARVKQRNLASYLGITEVSLSRLKGRLRRLA